MLNPLQLAQAEVQTYIRQHENDDEKQLVLKHREILGLPSSSIAEQIIGRRKARTKIPTYYNTAGIIYPPGVNLEQSSSEETATLKGKLLLHHTRHQNVLVDLTGGFGVDSYFLSKVFKRVRYIDKNGALMAIARHNHQVLAASNISHELNDADTFLHSFDGEADCFFIDPSRRSTTSQKVFKLADCEPDVTKIQSVMLEKARHVMIKTSPLLDISQGLRELDRVTEVIVVAVDNECKEVLFVLDNTHEGEPAITSVHLQRGGSEEFSFTLSDEKNATAEFSSVQEYVYEPNAALMKAGAFKIISSHYSIPKLHASTHLYTSKELLTEFPGRIFQVESILKHDTKVVQQSFKDGKANVVTRNYPLPAEELRKSLRLKDGGNQYLLAFTSSEGKQLCQASRIK